VKDATSQLRTATRRFKSDVANKLVGMFLHEVSRRISREWPLKVDGEEYGKLVRDRFNNLCPYCSRDLTDTLPVVEHLDGMNRYRAGLHVAGNVLVACRRCNGEKRRDDSLKTLSLAVSGWESFLSHDGSRCAASCLTCAYWKSVWEDDMERRLRLSQSMQKIRSFRSAFPELALTLPWVAETLPALLAKLYTDCQAFAETEIRSLSEKFEAMRPQAEAADADPHAPDETGAP
jgi:hypothetical protein